MNENVELLSQLPFNRIHSIVIYMFLNPDMPLKISYPLDESDDMIDFNVIISPFEIHEVSSNENELLNMCLAMSRATI
jgi:hypothetical protein